MINTVMKTNCTTGTGVIRLGLIMALAVFVVAAAPGCDRSKGGEEAGGEAREEQKVQVMRSDEEPCTLSEPCAESAAQVESLEPGDERVKGAMFIDAREEADFKEWSYRGARHLAYDFLEPPAATVVEEFMNRDGGLIVVYGDGKVPDTGEALARELASYGVFDIYFLEGGAPALQKHLGLNEGSGGTGDDGDDEE